LHNYSTVLLSPYTVIMYKLNGVLYTVLYEYGILYCTLYRVSSRVQSLYSIRRVWLKYGTVLRTPCCAVHYRKVPYPIYVMLQYHRSLSFIHMLKFKVIFLLSQCHTGTKHMRTTLRTKWNDADVVAFTVHFVCK